MTAFDHRRIGVVLLAAVLAVAGGCGGSDSKKQAQDKAAQKKARAAAAAQRSDGDRYASAVYLAKGLPPIELRYDLLSKPVAGAPLEVELAITPRNGGERLEFEVKGMPGLDVLTGGAASFQGVVGHQTYVAKVQVQPQAAGIYYLNVDVHLTTKVVNDDVSYSVPVVAAEAPPPPADAAAAPGAAPAAGAPAASPTAPATAKPATSPKP